MTTTLIKLEKCLNRLEQEALLCDRKRKQAKRPIFNHILFRGQSHYLVPCVREIKQTLNIIKSETVNGSLTSEKADFLTEKIITQIEAVQREILAQTSQTPRSSSSTKPIKELYQDLVQHHEWEKRLTAKVREQEGHLRYASSLVEQQSMHAQLLVTEQRLERCKTATMTLKQHIMHREKNERN